MFFADTSSHFVWDFDPVLLRLGGLQIRYYGILFAAAIYVGYLLMKWQFKRGGLGESKADYLFLYGTVGIVLGARLGHFLFYEPAVFLEDPARIIKIWEGGLASHGAAVGILLACWIYVKRHKVPIVEVLDRMAMSVALGSSFIRLGNFLNSEIVGKVSSVSWAIIFRRYDNQPRIPTQFIEIAMGIVTFLVLYLIDRRMGERRPRGLVGSLFLIIYFSMRFGVEFFKEEQAEFLIGHGLPLTMGQFLSIPCVAGGLVWLFFTIKNWYIPETISAPPETGDQKGPYVKRKKKK